MVTVEISSATTEPQEPVLGRDDAIRLEAISKRFGRVEAVKECNLSIPRGSFVSLLGPSGCGKTTLLRVIGGFERQDSGEVWVHGNRVNDLPPNKRNVNTIFQGYALFPHKTVSANVAFPLEIKRVPKAQRRERVREMLNLVRLDGMETRRASQLSGGQRQRVALARALAGRPEVLLLDEPLAALDLQLRKTMQLELRRIQQELGTTFLYVTHDQGEALTMSDRIVLMDGGCVMQEGTPRELYDRPRTVFASNFIGESNLLPGTIWKRTEAGLQVSVGDILVLAPDDPSFAAGDKVIVSIRPEQLIASNNGALGDCENQVAGVVVQQVFLGHLVRYHIELPTGTTLTIERNAALDEGWSTGTAVEVGWSQAAVNVLREQ